MASSLAISLMFVLVKVSVWRSATQRCSVLIVGVYGDARTLAIASPAPKVSVELKSGQNVGKKKSLAEFA